MRRISRVAALVVLLGGLAACTSEPDDPSEGAQDAADRVATALQDGDLTGVATSVATDVPDLLGDLEDTPVTVAAGDVTVADGEATTTLDWAWDLGEGHTWTYDTPARLTRTPETAGGWTLDWAPTVVEPSLAAGESLAVNSLLARRGNVLGADGKALVKPRTVVHYGLDKTKVGPARQATSARRIAEALDVDAASYVRSVRAAGDRAFVEALTLRIADVAVVPRSFADIPGAVEVSGTLPLAPTREFAAPILGTVGPATAEIVADSDGAIRAGDVVGLSGLQARYDGQLRGTPGREVVARDAAGRSRTLYSYRPVAGTPLRLTLDQDLQTRAERVLSGVGGSNASALVAIRPSTGAILAAANGPGTGGQDIATYGQYAPGSTFKVVSSLALLRSGLTPSTDVACPAATVVDGKTFTNYDDYPASGLGRIPFEQAVANSCNTAFIGQRDRLSGSDLSDAAAALGLGADFDTGFPSYFGQVPAPASETEAAADLIGQGKVLASPMTMAAVAASVEAGRTVVPHLVDAVTPTASPAVPLTRGEARSLRTLMRAVVISGSGALLAGLPGEVGAKTGTAEYGTSDGGSLPTHAWMIAFQGDLAVAVFVEDGASGSGTAGPLLLDFLDG